MALPPNDDPLDAEAGNRIPLAEEHVRVSTRPVETGRVQVRLATEEVEELVRATLKGRRASIRRIPMDREVSEPPPVRQEGEVVVVPVVEEVLVVERRLRLREEIHLRLEATEEDVAVPVRRRVQRAEVRRVRRAEIERAEIKRVDATGTAPTAQPDPGEIAPGRAATDNQESHE